ncbi:MAG TPA: Gfo/Idh/MocA family oxidoreductase [Anaerolineae bacterium]|nr:Gfo/Idh/MocA family oxidoreductase [Anaerolineae bacterium]HPL27994.1 Gfo/Idh/MocA family oxidoreductase [Anaerolineae bacterium]
MANCEAEGCALGRALRMGMVGGGRGSFIGAVHRRAATLDGGVELVAGAFATTLERSRSMGRELRLPDERVYGTWQEMLEGEAARPAEERLDFVAVITPNDTHYPIARAFLEAGVHVVCDKPMTTTLADARALVGVVEATGLVFALTHNYSAYPMVKQARHMVQHGQLGRVQKVVIEYPQAWLLRKIEDEGHKQAVWRTDPRRAGAAGCMGDIGTHAEQLGRYITGLEIDEICADLTTFVPGRQLEDDGAVLIHYVGGARGILYASQICTGAENGLAIHVYGTEGAVAWRQEAPNHLHFWSAEGPEHILKRGGSDLCPSARRASRVPGGHPEGFVEAFANIYRNATDTMRARLCGREPAALELDFPTVYDGARGVYFVEKVVESARSQQKWLPARWA